MVLFSEIKDRFFNYLELFPFLGQDFSVEKLNFKHTPFIVEWRNNPCNLKLFENSISITNETQDNFIRNYSTLNRVDIVVNYKDMPIGVFNIKNLDKEPEYGSLIGNNDFRGKGYGNLIKKAFFEYWFNVLEQDVIYSKIKDENRFLLDSNLRKGFSFVRFENELTVVKLEKKIYNEW
ncbi:GNAT family N-acetyltransferase [Myroides odoratimimus]|uniref:GNAT family N-acetyltransferase n=1 Tax=Myroides odoratimimus TaxID=76832 RepID=UPI003D2ED441